MAGKSPQFSPQVLKFLSVDERVSPLIFMWVKGLRLWFWSKGQIAVHIVQSLLGFLMGMLSPSTGDFILLLEDFNSKYPLIVDVLHFSG